MSENIKLIVGLGNPGTEYEHTRHNAGFWFVDLLANQCGASFKSDKKFFGDYCQIQIEGQELKLLKPMTFMNRSGQSVAALMNFYKIPPENVLVAHDELDFPAGRIRIKKGGGHGGHNGLRDIIAKTGKKEFFRLRIGIEHPGSSERVTGHVLGKPSTNDRELIDDAIYDAAKITGMLCNGEIQKATQSLHRN